MAAPPQEYCTPGGHTSRRVVRRVTARTKAFAPCSYWSGEAVMNALLLLALVALALSLGYLLHCCAAESEEDFHPESHAHRGLL